MTDLTTDQRDEVIELIEAIYLHEGTNPPKLPECKGHDCNNDNCPIDLLALVGVWVPWLLRLGWQPLLPFGGFSWHMPYTDNEAEQDVTFCGACYSNIKHKLAVTDPNFMLATARAVRVQQTGGE